MIQHEQSHAITMYYSSKAALLSLQFAWHESTLACQKRCQQGHAKPYQILTRPIIRAQCEMTEAVSK